MSREPFFPRAQAQQAKKDKQPRSQSPRAPQSAVDCQVRPNRWQQSPWTLVKSTQRTNALRARSSRQKLLQEFPKSFALKPKVIETRDTEKSRFTQAAQAHYVWVRASEVIWSEFSRIISVLSDAK